MARKRSALVIALVACACGIAAPAARSAPLAFVKVCKDVRGSETDNFTFIVNEVDTSVSPGPRTVTVPPGGCSQDLGVAGGHDIRVTEIAPPGWSLIGVIGQGASFSLVNNTAIVNAPPGGTTTITFRNERVDTGPVRRRTGRLKICKVAGPGVGVGTLFTFAIDAPEGPHPPITLAAGAEPGGNCVLGPELIAGRTATVTEAAKPGVVVSTIRVAPLARLTSDPDFAARSVEVAIETGITEVTFTNRVRGLRYGWLELCVDDRRRRPHLLSVRDRAGDVGTYVVRTGGCSAAIPVAAGNVAIARRSPGATELRRCRTFPARRQSGCDRRRGISRVTVSEGDESTQTVAFLASR